MIDTKIFLVVFFLISYAGVGYLGYEAADTSCTLDKSVFHISQQDLIIKETARKAEIENAQFKTLVTVQGDLSQLNQGVDKEYSLALNTPLTDTASRDDDRLSDSKGSSDNDTDLSDSTKAASGLPAKTGNCIEGYEAKLQRLYERQLEIARDCDITANYYNSLLKLYHSIESK